MSRLSIVMAVILVSGATCTAWAQTPADGGAKWRWIVRPDFMQAGLTLGEHVSGGTKVGASATVDCVLDHSRRPSQCVVVEETPGSDMGKGVIAVSRYYKALSVDEAGKSTEGRKVRFAMAYGGEESN